MSTKTGFVKDAKGNSEMAFWQYHSRIRSSSKCSIDELWGTIQRSKELIELQYPTKALFFLLK